MTAESCKYNATFIPVASSSTKNLKHLIDATKENFFPANIIYGYNCL